MGEVVELDAGSPPGAVDPLEAKGEESLHKVELVVVGHFVAFAAQLPQKPSEGGHPSDALLRCFYADAVDLVEVVAAGQDAGSQKHAVRKPLEVSFF